MPIESLLLAAPAVVLLISAVAVIAVGYVLASCAVTRIQGKSCS